MYDITLTGSIVQSARTPQEAYDKAVEISKRFVGRLIRVHGIDGIEVLAEYRDGVRELTL